MYNQSTIKNNMNYDIIDIKNVINDIINDDLDNDENYNLSELDASWIHEFEKEDRLYKDFYLEDLYYINLYFVYLNEYDSIEKVKKDKFFMTVPNCISKEELFKIIVKNKYINNEKYKLNFLFKYNLTIEPVNIFHFIKNNTHIETNANNQYLSPITSIENVQFKQTISMFHDLNSVTIIYKKPRLINSNIITNDSSDTKQNDNNKTKKLWIKNLIRKTRRLYA